MLCALNITPVEYMIKQAKLDFFLRIMENEYTKKIIEYTLSLPTQNDLISEIMMIVDQLDEPLVQLQTKFTDKVKAAKYVIEVQMESDKLGNDQANEVKEVLRIKNRGEIPKKLFNILRFDN